MSAIFWGLEIFSICMIVLALLLLLKGEGSREQKLMQYFLLGALVQNAGYLLEMTAPTMEAAIVAVKIEYLGSLIIPISYCHFMFYYCYEKVPQRVLRLLKIADAVILALVFTCDHHRLYYRSIGWMAAADGHGYLHLDYGPGYWAFMLCGTIVPYALSLHALIRACIKKPERAADRRYRLILLLSFLPVGALASYSMKLTYVYDLTPLVLGLVLSSVVILIWSRKIYDLGSLASGILLASMSDGVIALDAQRRIASYNPAAAMIFTELDSRAVGRSVDRLEGFPQQIWSGDAKEEFCLNGRFYEGRAESILDQYGKEQGHVVLLLDVTETRNYIEEIKKVREQAEQANSAKSAFLANMSHEIRTPMNAIVGLSDIIMEESRGREVYGYACDIKSASQDLLALINDILDLSKVEAGRMELVLAGYHMRTLVNGVLSMIDIVASRRGLAVESRFDMTIPCRYLGDAGRIRQILINIMNNAVKFTKEGHVRLSVSGAKGSAEDMEDLIFEIEDTGCGIRKEDIDGIFENFKQVDLRRDRSVEGTGLGLSITKHLVSLMQGTIEVESVYGEGTTFIVRIPQKIVDSRPLSEVPEEQAHKEERIDMFTAGSQRVLIVDDNPVNRKVARILMQSYGLGIEEADSGPAAIALVRKERYDIIFMDHMMPGMDGVEAVRIIRKECGENGTKPVVIALTANAMEGVLETFLANGFQDLLVKPIDRRTLHEMLLKWIPEEKRVPGRTPVRAFQEDDARSMAFRDVLIEGIDTDEAARRYPGSIEGYRDLLSLYCLDGRRKQKLLLRLWESRDYKTYGIEVHGLKSASANVGAMRISASAREQEQAVDRGDTSFVDSHVHQFLDDHAAQLGYIEAFLAADGSADGADEMVCPIAQADLLRGVKEALGSLEDFRSKECAQKVEELLRHQSEPEIQACLKETWELLRLYEDDAAEEKLRELIGKLEEREDIKETKEIKEAEKEEDIR